MDSRPVIMENAHRRTKSSGVLQSIMTKNRNRVSRDISHEQALGVRNINSQTTMPLLPPDHPHSKALGEENVAPVRQDDQRRSRRERRDDDKAPSKRSKSTVSLRSLVSGGGDDKESRRKADKDRGESPEKKSRRPRSQKPVKTKSSTGLSAMFAKMNKSNKDLSLSQPPESEDRENLSPSSSAAGSIQTPIWAQFATKDDPGAAMSNPKVRPDVTDERLREVKDQIDRYTPKDYSPDKQRGFHGSQPVLSRPSSSARPKSAILTGTLPKPYMLERRYSAERTQLGSRGSDSSRSGMQASDQIMPRHVLERTRTDPTANVFRKISSSSSEQAPARGLTIAKRGTRVMAAVAALTGKSEDELATSSSRAKPLDPKSVNDAFESVLEARNIPEDQRLKMRSLTLHVKAEFVRQDKGASRPGSPRKASTWSQSGDVVAEDAARTSIDDDTSAESKDGKNASKRSRPRSKTFTFSKADSPTKKQKASSRPTSIHGAEQLTSPTNTSSPDKRSSWARGAPTKPSLPQDFVTYLLSAHDPTTTEVGRLHKLRILLRNETVAWVDAFVASGGMAAILALLHRVMAMQWRDEHEDQLLHETLLCLKGLCTTKAAVQSLNEVADTLFPALLGMLFDEEKKGPAEFATRGIIIAVLFAYLGAANAGAADADAEEGALANRARELLTYLADPQKPEDEKPLAFVLDMLSLIHI